MGLFVEGDVYQQPVLWGLIMRWKRRLKKEVVNAVHDDDIEQFLVSLGVFNDVLAGKYKCLICNQPIDIENIGIITTKDNKIKFVCESPSCLLIMELNSSGDQNENN